MAAVHVLSAVFLIGPVAALPMVALRALREGNGRAANALASGTQVFNTASLATLVLGAGALGMAPERLNWSFGSLWVWLSIVLALAAGTITQVAVIPSLRSAAGALTGAAGNRTGAAPAGDGEAAAAGAAAIHPGVDRRVYGRVAMFAGIASTLLAAVVVLMVVKP